MLAVIKFGDVVALQESLNECWYCERVKCCLNVGNNRASSALLDGNWRMIDQNNSLTTAVLSIVIND